MERWRFNYGRKVTPQRVARFHLPTNEALLERVKQSIKDSEEIKRLAIENAEEADDVNVARARLAEIERDPSQLIRGEDLEQILAKKRTSTNED